MEDSVMITFWGWAYKKNIKNIKKTKVSEIKIPTETESNQKHYL